MPKAGQMSFTRQQSPLGLGHAVWCARHLVGNEPFAVLLPDMLHQAETPCLKAMIDDYKLHHGNIIAAYPVPETETHHYGIVDLGGSQEQRPVLRGMIEKPKAGTAPSQFAISGRYILSPKIFSILEHQPRGAGGEIQLTDAMVTLMKDEPFYAHLFHGQVYDTGNRLGFLTANLAYALKTPGLSDELRHAFQSLVALS